MASNLTSSSLVCGSANLHDGMQGIQRVAVDDERAQLLVTFYRPIVLPAQSYLLNTASYSLTGGQRLFPHVTRAELPGPASPPQALTHQQVLLTLDGEGDFSIYTLTVTGPDIDPFFASHTLRFRLGCDERFDCRAPLPEAPPPAELPIVIDYLAKDYSSFRQALLDFISARMPAWTERSEADMGIMLAELFAYTADNLSYMQDRVANEAFLGTATQRRSIAGHLQLIGYQMDEGASAHTWLQFQVGSVHTLTTEFKVSNQTKTASEPVIVFEPLGAARLDPAHNSMSLYSWGNQNCCLPPNALTAALAGSYPNLGKGDYLLIDDGKGHRDVVRLSAPPEILPAPFMSSPPGSPPATSPPGGMITVLQWSSKTPLHYDYCAADVTVRGNMAVATHGETIDAPDVFVAPPAGPQRLRLELSMAPLAYLDTTTVALAAPMSASSASAPTFGSSAPNSTSTLQLTVDGVPWQQQQSLLDSGADAHVYRVEIDDQGQATIVFGQGGSGGSDQQFGLRPPENAKIEAVYRVGGGAAGNVAADTLTSPHPSQFDPLDWFVSVTNPLPATGGRDLESRDHARRFAPPAFQNRLVAVTASDYQIAAQQFTQADGTRPIGRANADFRWTGSWLTVGLGVEAHGVEGLAPQLEADVTSYLDTRRLAGYDLEITGATYVPVDLMINFCVSPGFRSAAVQQAIEQALSNVELPDGARGFFYPDNFSFGDKLYVSQLYAAIMGVPGIESARIVRLARLHANNPDDETRANLGRGYLAVGVDEIVRLDNDRNFPENGVLTVQSLDIAQ